MHQPLKNLADELNRRQLRRGHEETDADVKPVARAVALILTIVVVAIGLAALLFDYFTQRESRRAQPSPPMAEIDLLPPAPRLQVVPGTDIERLRAREDAVLSSYGRLDRETGIARVPIDRATEIMLERGFPERPTNKEERHASSR